MILKNFLMDYPFTLHAPKNDCNCALSAAKTAALFGSTIYRAISRQQASVCGQNSQFSFQKKDSFRGLRVILSRQSNVSTSSISSTSSNVFSNKMTMLSISTRNDLHRRLDKKNIQRSVKRTRHITWTRWYRNVAIGAKMRGM